MYKPAALSILLTVGGQGAVEFNRHDRLCSITGDPPFHFLSVLADF
jgi:hypothetical protein